LFEQPWACGLCARQGDIRLRLDAQRFFEFRNAERDPRAGDPRERYIASASLPLPVLLDLQLAVEQIDRPVGLARLEMRKHIRNVLFPRHDSHSFCECSHDSYSFNQEFADGFDRIPVDTLLLTCAGFWAEKQRVFRPIALKPPLTSPPPALAPRSPSRQSKTHRS
jgi:hypothetical protein